MNTVTIIFEGQSPLLMHAYPLVPPEALEKKSPEEQATWAAYRTPDTGELYIPAVNFQRALVAAAVYSKGKGRGSLARIAAACLLVSPERLLLGTRDYAIDARPVVIPATKGRVIRYRPRLDKWRASCMLEWDERLLTAAQVRRIVDDAGSRVGVLEFRPEKRGSFGRFAVIHWDAT